MKKFNEFNKTKCREAIYQILESNPDALPSMAENRFYTDRNGKVFISGFMQFVARQMLIGNESTTIKT